MAPDTRNAFCSDLRLAQDAVRAGVVPSRANAADKTFCLWQTFCQELGVDPWLQGQAERADPVLFLQVFAHRYRTGVIAPKGKPVRSRTVEDALRSVGQAFAALGASDPRLNPQGKPDFRIQRQLKAYAKQDPPPHRVKPIPVSVIRNVLFVALASAAVSVLAIADMVALAFFFLLRPGEYTGTKSETTPFRVQDVQLWIGRQRLDITTASDADIASATFCSLTFTSQKNGVRGEVIGLGRSGDSQLCPVRSVTRRVLHLRQHNAPPETPLATYFNGSKFVAVSPQAITTVLQQAVHVAGPSIGFLASDVSARSLRAGGAMALLCAHVDKDTIRLLGRWRSDEMLRYLHVQAAPIMEKFSRLMVSSDANYALIPGQDVPSF
jgi:hypothetical protein